MDHPTIPGKCNVDNVYRTSYLNCQYCIQGNIFKLQCIKQNTQQLYNASVTHIWCIPWQQVLGYHISHRLVDQGIVVWFLTRRSTSLLQNVQTRCNIFYSFCIHTIRLTNTYSLTDFISISKTLWLNKQRRFHAQGQYTQKHNLIQTEYNGS